MRHATQGPEVSAKTKRGIHYSGEQVGLWTMHILTALLCAFVIGVTITESLASVHPRIPETINNQIPPHQPEPDGQISTIRSEHILLYVRRADRQRLIQTIAHDVAVHGGVAVNKTADSSSSTFSVPQAYLKRIQLLSEISGVKPPNGAYRRWAIAVYYYPHDQSITGPNDTDLTVRIAVPLTGSPGTKPLIKWTLIPSLIALLIILAAFSYERISKAR